MQVRVGAAFWVQRTGWPELRDAILRAEAAGFDDVWIDDHLLCDEGDWPDPKLEGWTTLAAAAAITSRVRLGLLVSANTFRNPGVTAKIVATLDHVSSGRAILGIGGGWFEREHEAFGIDFGASFGERLDRLAEAVSLIRRLLDGERVTHVGRHYAFRDAVCAPGPVQAHLPILIGGSGPRKTLPLVARLADLWNAYGTPEELESKDATLRAACTAIGRDPATIGRSVSLNVVVRRDRDLAARDWETWRARHRPQEGEDRGDVLGTVEDAVLLLARYRAIGVTHSIWIFRTPYDLETMDRLAEVRAGLED